MLDWACVSQFSALEGQEMSSSASFAHLSETHSSYKNKLKDLWLFEADYFVLFTKDLYHIIFYV